MTPDELLRKPVPRRKEDRPGPDIGVKTSATGLPVGQPFRLRPGFQPGQSLRGLKGLARAESPPSGRGAPDGSFATETV